MILRLIRKTLLIVAILTLVVGGGVGLALYWLVAVNPGESISPKYLENILAVESPVYYSDGKDKIGVFFENDHRQYIAFQQIPKNFVNSIVAAEDHKFFQHYGIDFLGVSRAMIHNLKAGRVVQGGSTITQQTAKNLYKRKDRSLKEKFKELIYAWRLEYHYSKEKILEFYVNQFYVSGNGRGLGVAANYYFDKPAKELGLLESAFIAGSVKRPNYYNPFLKKDEASAQEARHRAKSRAGYVLGRMHELGMISSQQYQENLDKDVPFRQGQMSYALNTIMDMVKEALAEADVETALVSHGIENVATSGIKIYTTIEKDLQDQSFYALKKELSRLSVRLEGYDKKSLQENYAKLKKTGNKVESGEFIFGRIAAVSVGEDPALTVSFQQTRNGSIEEITGVVDSKGLSLFLSSLVKYNQQRWSEAKSGDMDKFLSNFSPGDQVYVSVRGYDEASSRYLLHLEKYPQLQGGLVVLKNGSIRAMVGGNENRFYNRVLARRLMGSTAKPLLYTAAIQLGWNSLDLLNNERDAFVYHGQTYFPRPDHHSPFSGVSINWAGTKSENVASVWLLYNLCERLSEGQFRKLTEGLGLARGKNEQYVHYMERVRDGFGIMVNKKQLQRLAFVKALEEIGPDLLFSGKSSEYALLQRFHYELEDDVVEKDDTSSEADIRRQILKMTYVKLAQLAEDFDLFRRDAAKRRGELSASWLQKTSSWQGENKLYYNSFTEVYSFGEPPQEGVWLIVDPLSLEKIIKQTAVAGKKWEWGDVLLNRMVSLSTFEFLKKTVAKEYEQLSRLRAYGPDVLYQIKDFRILVGLRYLIALCKEMGIESPMEAVLSFPLGSNVITLLDIARAYETIGTGTREYSGRFGAGNGLLLIDRIESSSGEIVYRPKRSAKRIIDNKTSLAVTDSLRNVVKYGTGKYARDNVQIVQKVRQGDQVQAEITVPVPLFGKTGTANSFRNSSFAGFVPSPAPGNKGVQVQDGYVIASYVGYDDNKPMVRKTTRISGSSGALPVWSMVAQAIVDRGNYSSLLETEGMVLDGDREIPVNYLGLGQIHIASDGENKINVDDSWKMSYSNKVGSVKYSNGMITFGEIDPDGVILPTRYFKPYWTLMN